jgi:hypothetical protein
MQELDLEEGRDTFSYARNPYRKTLPFEHRVYITEHATNSMSRRLHTTYVEFSNT